MCGPATVVAPASGGVTPLHRAVRNRCTPTVRALLAAGADPHQRSDSGSTAFTLAEWTTGRSGSGSVEAKQEQANIVGLLAATG
ncbi:MAG: ankyrin repeat domain-containing protein [Ilumatobacteraceae bacterium]